jgi:hypothetical protein
MRAFRALIEDEDIDGLEYLVGKEDPDLEIALAKDPADMSPNEIGALNKKYTYYSGCIIILILKHPYFRRSDGYERLLMAILLMLTDRLVTFLITLI